MLTISRYIYKHISENFLKNFLTNEVFLYMEPNINMIPILYDIRVIDNSL